MFFVVSPFSFEAERPVVIFAIILYEPTLRLFSVSPAFDPCHF